MLLVQPVAESLERTPLISVELDRTLSDLPLLEAVRSPQGWYFAEKYPVVYSPGIMLEQALRPRVNLSSPRRILAR